MDHLLARSSKIRPRTGRWSWPDAYGRLEEAKAAFLRARKKFEETGLAYDYALVNLDLSLVLLQQGRMAEVKALAGEMLGFFESQGIEREALAAVRLFCEGARQEAATAELAQRVRRFLRRAKLDPGLKFEGAG